MYTNSQAKEDQKLYFEDLSILIIGIVAYIVIQGTPPLFFCFDKFRYFSKRKFYSNPIFLNWIIYILVWIEKLGLFPINERTPFIIRPSITVYFIDLFYNLRTIYIASWVSILCIFHFNLIYTYWAYWNKKMLFNVSIFRLDKLFLILSPWFFEWLI